MVHIPDVLQDPEYSWSEAQRLGNYRSALGVPLIREGNVVGVIFVGKNVPQPFAQKQIALVSVFADQAVIAIENNRLLDELDKRTEDLAESLRQQTATADVLKAISRSAFDLQTVLQTLVESAVNLCQAEKGTITRQKGDTFYRAKSFGFSVEFIDYVRTVPVEPERGSAIGRALLEGRIVHIADVKNDPDYNFVEAQRLGDFRTILVVPMLREGVPVGAIGLTRPEVKHPHSYYDDHFSKLKPDVAHLVVRELFTWRGDDRYSSRSVYLQIYARPSAYSINDNYYGGGRTFNGPPNTGGGVIQLELSWLMTAENFPFLSTLIHELGHAFGLTNADCHGYDMDTNRSMMSSNTQLWSKGSSLSTPPPVFNPEEYLILAQNKLAFPNFNFIPPLHNPRGRSLATAESCSLGWMDESIGKYRHVPGMGYELFWDGKRVNGPEAAFYTRQEARENCAWNKQDHPARVACTYNGGPFMVDRRR